MRGLIVLAVAISFPFVSAQAQKRCVKGIPCGNTCISAAKTCHIGSTRPPAATVAPSPRPDTSGAAVTQAGEPITATYGKSTDPWVASAMGLTYYRNGCSGARKLSPKNLMYFKTEESAQRAGYRRSAQKGC